MCVYINSYNILSKAYFTDRMNFVKAVDGKKMPPIIAYNYIHYCIPCRQVF